MRGSSGLFVAAAASRIFFQATPSSPTFLPSRTSTVLRSGDVVARQQAGLTFVDGAAYARWAKRQPVEEPRRPASRRGYKRTHTISSFVAVMFSLAYVVVAKAFGAVVSRPPSPEQRPPAKTAMLSLMGQDSNVKSGGSLKPRFERMRQALLDDNVFRAAELNRARLCTIFCVAMSAQPVMDGAESLMIKLFRAGDPGEWGKLLSLFVYLSWGPILDSVNRNAIEGRQKVAKDEFDPLNLYEGAPKVRRRMEAIERQFDRPAKLAIFFYLLELIAANTSVLRESRMAISELRNVITHEGDLQVLLEKSTAACLQIGCNLPDIEHDVDSISAKIGEFLHQFDRTVHAE